MQCNTSQCLETALRVQLKGDVALRLLPRLACLQVRWHVTATRWHMMHLWERILADLGISWEYLDA